MKPMSEEAAKLLGEIVHRSEVARTMDVDPVPQLARAHRHSLSGHAGRAKCLAKFLVREPYEILLLHLSIMPSAPAERAVQYRRFQQQPSQRAQKCCL